MAPYTTGVEGPLWQIMAEVLSILAVFTKTMKENRLRISVSVPLIHPLL